MGYNLRQFELEDKFSQVLTLVVYPFSSYCSNTRSTFASIMLLAKTEAR